MKVVVLTSTARRHQAFAKAIHENANVVHTIFENKTQSAKLTEKEAFYFDEWMPDSYTRCEKGDVNSDTIRNIIKGVEPDYLLVFGTSILGPSVIDIPKQGALNIHTGLTQYYRGVDSHMWAVMDERLDRIGVTIHHVDTGIDTGRPVAQATLQSIVFMDDLDDVFLKNCQLGIDIMSSIARTLSHASWPYSHMFEDMEDGGYGKLYKIKDKTQDIVQEAERKLFKMLMERK